MNYDFNVQLTPVSTKFGDVSNRKAVVKDNGEFLGIVSNSYQVIPHKEVVQGFRDALGDNVVEKIELKKNGAHMFLTYRVPDIRIEVAKGDVMELQFIAKNSYDGSTALQLTLGAYRMVCSNGMVIGKTFFNYSQRHTGDVGIQVDVLKLQIEMMTENFRNSAQAMKEMVATPIGTDTEELFSHPIGIPSYLMDKASEEYRRANNRTQWGFYNAMTWAITHQMKKSSPQAAIDYSRIAWREAQSIM